MNHASIKTILTLEEGDARKDKHKEIIGLALDTDEGVLWHFAKSARLIDEIYAKFNEPKNVENKQGMVSVWISLLAGEKFLKPYISLNKDPSNEPSEIPYVKFSPEKDGSIVALDFLEPESTEPHRYPNIYFHTTKGVVDPTIIIRRIIPE